MIEGIKPYAEYKESGSQWIGSVPSRWTVCNLRTLITSRSERNHPDLPLLSVAREKGCFVRSLTDANENHNFIPDDLTNYKVARAGNLVINKMKAWQGSMGIAPCDGIVSPAYFVFEFRIANHAFGQALLRSKPYVAHFGQASDGVRIGQWDLSIPGMRQIPVLVPTEDEQAAIVRFLEHANRKINHFIHTKRRLIELLNEEKQVIIHRTVTTGLVQAVPMKDSGVKWLGEVPAHWEICTIRRKLKNGTNGMKIGPFGSQLKLEYMQKFGYKVYGQENIIANDFSIGLRYIGDEKYSELSVYSITPGDLLISMMGTSGRCQIVPNGIQAGIMDSHLLRLRLKDDDLDPMFISLLIDKSQYVKNQINISGKGAIMHGLNSSIVKNIILAIPGKTEQCAIVSYLHTETSRIDALISRIRKGIEMHIEYRTRLISDVVTGKLDVRGVELPAMDETEALEIIDTGEETETESEELIENEEVADADE